MAAETSTAPTWVTRLRRKVEWCLGAEKLSYLVGMVLSGSGLGGLANFYFECCFGFESLDAFWSFYFWIGISRVCEGLFEDRLEVVGDTD